MKTLRILTVVFIALAFLLVISAWAGTVNLPKTGQTACYDQYGNVIDCTSTGQDGDWQAGVSWPSPRFTDNGDGTVTDNLTGLMWLKDANCIKTQYPSFDNDGTAGDGAVTWQHAFDFVAGINSGTYSNCGAGYTDWRLPNINELESLVHAGYNEEDCGGSSCLTLAAWLNTQGFTNVQSSYYWSSTTYAGYTDFAWGVGMWDGGVGVNGKAGNLSVWPVRAGQ